ncbi:unnamed protein product [Eruca vesicaria subsp. sativa]|uniref:peptidylprolyl isomerase n=1 Tax=Eruca vesicaria subsp. sativa TaxID=29727 RepID=A0ABC8IW70_ERUVS|nr:unnamed protein product [Eruca vesicaria subsp. sativa]
MKARAGNLLENPMKISAKSGDGQVILSHKEEPYFFTFGKSELYLPDYSDLQRFINLLGEFPMDCPLQDSRLSVHYKGMLLNEEKTVFYDSRIENNDQPLDFSSGEGLVSYYHVYRKPLVEFLSVCFFFLREQVPEGFEMCTRLMLPGEISLVTCPPIYAYDKFPRPPGVPEGAHVQWEIELLGFETPRDWTGLDFQSIMNEAENIRSTGNMLFKEGKFELTKTKYEKVLREFNHVNPQDDEEGKVFGEARNMLHLNVAACLLKLGEWRKSVETCNKVLEAKPGNVKGLYRRGMAYMAGGEYQDARNDFNMMIKVDKSSEADATTALLKLKQKEQEAENKARKQFKGLFNKKPGEITEVGSEIREETKTIQEVDETKDNDDGREEEESTTTVSSGKKRKWSEEAWLILKNVMVQIGIQLGVALFGVLIFQFFSAKFT